MKTFLLLLLIVLGTIITSCSSREERLAKIRTRSEIKSEIKSEYKSELNLVSDSNLINALNSFSNATISDKFIDNGIGYIIINNNDSIYVYKGTSPLFKRIYIVQQIGKKLIK